MSGQRQKNRPEQEVLAFPGESRSDAPKTTGEGTETLVAKRKPESLAGTERLMEEVCELENSKQALHYSRRHNAQSGDRAAPTLVYVDSERAGQRVMENITPFITHRLQLKVNQAKSAVARPGQGSFSDSASLANENLGGASLPRPSPASRSEFGNRRGEPAASISRRWSRRLRLTCGDGSGTSTTVKRPRYCKVLNLGCAADSGLWCRSNGSADERDSENFANGACAKTWRRKPPGVRTARGASPIRRP